MKSEDIKNIADLISMVKDKNVDIEIPNNSIIAFTPEQVLQHLQQLNLPMAARGKAESMVVVGIKNDDDEDFTIERFWFDRKTGTKTNEPEWFKKRLEVIRRADEKGIKN